MALGGTVAIIGGGIIERGESCARSLADMIDEAVTLGPAGARVEREPFEAAWPGRSEPFLSDVAMPAGDWNTRLDPSWNDTSFRATREAARAAYRVAGVTHPRREIEVAERHDCFTIPGIANIHDQLLGRAGTMQVTGARMGLAHNFGGPGAVPAAAVLARP